MILLSSSFLIGKTKLLGLGKRRTGKLDFSKANTFKNSLFMIVWMVSITRFVLFFPKISFIGSNTNNVSVLSFPLAYSYRFLWQLTVISANHA